MNVNKHIDNNLYKSKIRNYSILQIIKNLLSFGSITSVFLFGAYSVLDPDFAYIAGIVIIALIGILNNSVLKGPYWFIRPKINQSLFSNILNITNLLFAFLSLLLIYFNYQNGKLDLEFGLIGSIIFALGLPISFYSWLVFAQTNEKAIAEIIEHDNLKSFKNYEIYVVLIFVAIFGLMYDYLPQSPEFLLLAPLGLLLILTAVDIWINKQIHSIIPKYFNALEISQEKKANHNSRIGIYEMQPYLLIDEISNDFLNKTLQEQKYLLFTLKRISAVDAIDHLATIIKDCDDKNPIFNTLLEIQDYLLKIASQLEKIENPYEFIEQSNDLNVIKGLIRKQIHSKDRNLIIKLLNDNRLSIKKPACIVAGYYEDINIISILIEQLERPELTYWAQLALNRIGERSIKYIEIEFTKRNENLLFVESCFNLLAKMGDETGYDLLFKALNDTDSNIRRVAAKKIILFSIDVPTNRKKYFAKLFDDLILSLISNDFLLAQLESKNENFKTLENALKNENKETLYLIINIVKLHYNVAAVEKLFEHYRKSSKNFHASSNTIIDLIVHDNISFRNKLKAIFSPYEKLLIESLQEEFPSINIKPSFQNEEDLIWVILKKEYDQINSWTRVCALNIMQYSFKDDIPFELASEFLNRNQLLKETAAMNIYNNLPEFYTIFLSRLSDTEAKKIDYTIRSNSEKLDEDNVDVDNFLLYDKIKFLISIPYLNDLSISEILNFHRYFKVKVLKAGEHQISLNEEFNLGYWLIETGNLSFSKNGQDFYNYSKRDIIKVSDHDSPSESVFFYLEKDTRFLVVEEIILMNIIKDYDYIMQNYIDILPDKSPENKIKELNQNAA